MITLFNYSLHILYPRVHNSLILYWHVIMCDNTDNLQSWHFVSQSSQLPNYLLTCVTMCDNTDNLQSWHFVSQSSQLLILYWHVSQCVITLISYSLDISYPRVHNYLILYWLMWQCVIILINYSPHISFPRVHNSLILYWQCDKVS